MKNKLVALILGMIPLLAPAKTIYVATNGNDSNGGSYAAPLKTLQKAVSVAVEGDIIELRNGTYASDEIKIKINNLTIKSYAGEWAKIVAPVNKGTDIAACLWYSEPDTKGGTLENLEIVGGAFYGIFLDSNWNWGLPKNERSGVSNILIKNCKIHDTGRDCIKITPGCNNIQIIQCEIYNSGVGPENLPINGGPNAEGIDNVNGSNMVVRYCHFHDISTNALYAKGGSKGSIIENNLIRNVGEAGIGIGFYTDGEWFDEITNPKYYESINTIVRNNIIMNTGAAGIVFCGAYRCQAYNNTIVTASPKYHAPLTFLSGEVGIDDTLTLNPISTEISCFNNIFVDQSGSTDDDFTVLVRENALEGNNVIDYNLYYKSNGGNCAFDDNDWPGKTFAQWKTKYPYDVHSYETNPNLNGNMHLLSGSKAINAGKPTFAGMVDYDGLLRNDATNDLGADEFNNGAALTVPPPANVIGTGATTKTALLELPKVEYLVYPNPTNDVVFVKGQEHIENLILYDLTGTERKQSQQPFMRLNDLPTGVYILLIQHQSTFSKVKLVKQDQ
jgi:Right handed beta helix region/Secretion system C-terminal sorting domain